MEENNIFNKTKSLQDLKEDLKKEYLDVTCKIERARVFILDYYLGNKESYNDIALLEVQVRAMGEYASILLLRIKELKDVE